MVVSWQWAVYSQLNRGQQLESCSRIWGKLYQGLHQGDFEFWERHKALLEMGNLVQKQF